MSIQVGVGIGTEKDPLRALQTAVKQARHSLGSDKVDLAIVFSTIEFAYPAVFTTLSSLLEPTPIIGCSSLAIISGAGILKYGIALMLISLPEGVYINTALVKQVSSKSAIPAGEELGERLLSGFKNTRRDLSVVFSDGLIGNESDLLLGLQERLGTSFPLVGGAASDNLAFKQTYLYYNDGVYSDAICGILWGGKLNFGLGAKHGWKPLGKPRYVTKAVGNVVLEIDGLPAARIYEEYFSSDLAKLRNELKRISIFYPIGIYLPGEEEYLLRNILSIEKTGALVFQGNIPQESLIRLMIGTKESCLLATRQAIDEVRKSSLGRQIKLALIFDSVSRLILLGRQANKEIEIIKEQLGKETALLGIYTYGEQAPLKAVNYQGKAHFHNQTIAILGIEG